MELLDRYLQAVRFWLPKAQQDDIAAELSEDIHSQVEERESELGRTLNEGEIAAILKQRGRPVLVANRYLPQQYLIGPLLFPIYRFVFTLVALCYLVPWFLTWIGLMSFDPAYRASHSVGGDLLGSWGSLWLTAFIAIGVLTLVFAVLERVQARSNFLENWEPLKLPPVRNAKQIPRFSSIVELVANLVFLVWWVNWRWSQTVFERSGVRIVFAPVWRVFFWAFLLLAVVNIAAAGANLLRPYWTGTRASIRLATDCAGAILFCWLLKAHILAEISAPNLSAAKAATISNAINTYLAKSFPFAVMACVVFVGVPGVVRLVRLKRKQTGLTHGLAAIV